MHPPRKYKIDKMEAVILGKIIIIVYIFVLNWVDK